VPLSTQNLQGEEKSQYGKAHPPIENSDTQEHNKDEKMTKTYHTIKFRLK
jgi:hypothetical protein